MSGVVAVLPVVLPTILVVVVLLLLPGRGDTAPTGRLRLIDRSTRRWRVAGLAAGVLAALATLQLGLGLGPMLAGPVLVLGVLAGVLAGEIRIAAPGGVTRTATLEVRRARDYLPPALTSAVAVCLGYLVVLLAITTAMGSVDDMGRAGRRLFRQCTATVAEGRGPWPGSFYSVPLLIVVLGGLVAAVVAMSRIVRRPRQEGTLAQDDALRRQAGESVVAAVGLLVVVPLAGVIVVTAMTLGGFGCRPPAWGLAALVLPLTLPFLGVVGTWCVVILLRSALGRARSAAAEAARR